MDNLEKGYTKINNESLRILFSDKLTHRECRVMLFILRYTIGFNRKKACLSSGYISRGTGITRCHVIETLSSLRDKNYISYKSKRSKNSGHEISVGSPFTDTTCSTQKGTKGSTQKGTQDKKNKDPSSALGPLDPSLDGKKKRDWSAELGEGYEL